MSCSKQEEIVKELFNLFYSLYLLVVEMILALGKIKSRSNYICRVMKIVA